MSAAGKLAALARASSGAIGKDLYMDMQMYIEDLKSSVDSLDKRCKAYEKQIAELKQYLTAVDQSAFENLTYWDDALKKRLYDEETHLQFILAYKIYNHENTIVKTSFQILRSDI